MLSSCSAAPSTLPQPCRSLCAPLCQGLSQGGSHTAEDRQPCQGAVQGQCWAPHAKRPASRNSCLCRTCAPHMCGLVASNKRSCSATDCGHSITHALHERQSFRCTCRCTCIQMHMQIICGTCTCTCRHNGKLQQRNCPGNLFNAAVRCPQFILQEPSPPTCAVSSSGLSSSTEGPSSVTGPAGVASVTAWEAEAAAAQRVNTNHSNRVCVDEWIVLAECVYRCNLSCSQTRNSCRSARPYKHCTFSKPHH
jgi:hypothetical protein